MNATHTIKVLHVYKTYYPDTVGGVEAVIEQICTASQPLGIQSQVLTLSQEAHPIEHNAVTVHRAHLDLELASTGFSWQFIFMLKQLAEDVDVVHYHFPWPFMDMAHFLARVKKPTVLTYHSDIVKQKNLLKVYRPLMNQFLKSVDCIVATSPNYLETSEVLQCFKHKTRVIPIGLDRNSYPQPSNERLIEWRSKLPTQFFLFVGVLRYYKGLHTLLEALASCDYPTVIAGTGPETHQLQLQAKQLGLKNIIFLGKVSELDKFALLQLCFAFVFPSHLRSEAFGISLLEAAMYGKPLISCEIGTGTTYININQETGISLPPESPIALQQAMQRLWDHPNIAREMGVAAQARYNELFTSQKTTEQYVELYRMLTNEKASNEQD